MRTVTQNACRQCAPLGASIVFKGLSGTIGLIHGSQGCSTYIRRYMISHFREPVDIASSSFTEETAIFGGGDNLKKSLVNIITLYEPECIGIASTCLSETIGEDIKAFVLEFMHENRNIILPEIVCVSTPSYRGSHLEGFHETVLTCVKHFSGISKGPCDAVILPGMVSPSDIRYLKKIMKLYFKEPVVFPDYSDTLDGGLWDRYYPVPGGGTSLNSIKRIGNAETVIEFSGNMENDYSAGEYLKESFGADVQRIHIPIGVRLTDLFFDVLSKVTGKGIPESVEKERARVLDLYVDGHKYVFGKRVLLFGDSNLVTGLFSFCQETGLFPVLCCAGNKNSNFKTSIEELKDNSSGYETVVLDNADFKEIEEAAGLMNIDLMIGNSKGYKISDKLGIPLIRTGFPIHDRLGAGHIVHVGYSGAQSLFERIVNCFLEVRQKENKIRYSYI